MPNWRGRELRVACRQSNFEAIADIQAGSSYRLFIEIPLPGGLVDLELTVDRFDAVIGTDLRLLSIGIIEVGVDQVGIRFGPNSRVRRL